MWDDKTSPVCRMMEHRRTTGTHAAIGRRTPSGGFRTVEDLEALLPPKAASGNLSEQEIKKKLLERLESLIEEWARSSNRAEWRRRAKAALGEATKPIDEHCAQDGSRPLCPRMHDAYFKLSRLVETTQRVTRPTMPTARADRRENYQGVASLGDAGTSRLKLPRRVVRLGVLVACSLAVGVALNVMLGTSGGAAASRARLSDTDALSVCMTNLHAIAMSKGDVKQQAQQYRCPLSKAPYAVEERSGTFTVACPEPHNHGVKAIVHVQGAKAPRVLR